MFTLKLCGQCYIKRLIKSDPASINRHFLQAHVQLVADILEINLAILKLKSRNINFEIGIVGLWQYGIGINRLFEAIPPHCRVFLFEQVFKIQVARFITHHPSLETTDGNVVNHKTVGDKRPDSHRKTGIINRDKNIITTWFRQRQLINRQANTGKK